MRSGGRSRACRPIPHTAPPDRCRRWSAAPRCVAGRGAGFSSADLELTPEPRADHASYIASWLKVLKDDKRAIFTAAAHAQRAADYLNGLQAGQQEAAE